MFATDTGLSNVRLKFFSYSLLFRFFSSNGTMPAQIAHMHLLSSQKFHLHPLTFFFAAHPCLLRMFYRNINNRNVFRKDKRLFIYISGNINR